MNAADRGVGFVVGLGAFLLLALGLTVALAIFADREDSKRMAKLFGIFFAIRMVIALTFAFVPETRFFHEDSTGAELMGPAFSDFWTGEGPDPRFEMQYRGSRTGYFYVAGAFCYVFGSYRSFPSYGNALLGVAVCACIYRLARILYGRAVAWRATLFVGFLPSFVLWSSVATKEVLVMLLVSFVLLAFVEGRLNVDSLPVWWCLGGLGIVLCYFVRAYVAHLLALSALSTAFLAPRRTAAVNFVRQASGMAVLVVAALFVLSATGSTAPEMTQSEDVALASNFNRIMAFRSGLSSTANTGYANEIDLSNPFLWPLLLPLALIYFLYAPMPWHLVSLRAWFAVPETALWWSLAPSVVRGLKAAVKHDFVRVGPVVFFIVVLSIGYSVIHGNVGVAYRQRTTVVMFLLIFSSVDHVLRTTRKDVSSTDSPANSGTATPSEALEAR